MLCCLKHYPRAVFPLIYVRIRQARHSALLSMNCTLCLIRDEYILLWNAGSSYILRWQHGGCYNMVDQLFPPISPVCPSGNISHSVLSPFFSVPGYLTPSLSEYCARVRMRAHMRFPHIFEALTIKNICSLNTAIWWPIIASTGHIFSLFQNWIYKFDAGCTYYNEISKYTYLFIFIICDCGFEPGNATNWWHRDILDAGWVHWKDKALYCMCLNESAK